MSFEPYELPSVPLVDPQQCGECGGRRFTGYTRYKDGTVEMEECSVCDGTGKDMTRRPK